ncbi:hypothetical protein FQZ97_585350 [compost metagenome]
MPAARQRHRIIPADRHRQTRKPRALGDLSSPIGHPAIQLAPEVAPGCHAIGRGKLRIELDGLVEQRQRLLDGFPGAVVQFRRSAQVIVVGVQAFRRFALGALDFRPFELWRDCANNAFGDLILQFEDVVEHALEALCPDMRPGRRVDELPGDAHPVPALAHATFQHVAHAELLADFLDVHHPALEGEARIARDDE